MRFDPFKHHRRSIRLRGYDYSQSGAYFVTICTQHHQCVLGDILDGKMRLSECGKLALKWWIQIPDHFCHVDLDAWVVMPNHMHGIIVIDGHRRGEVPSPKLGNVVAYFKYQSTKEINKNHGTTGARFWQRNYYEHIVRNESDLDRIREYIENNPLNWEQDRNYIS